MAQKRGRPLNVQPARRKLNELFLTWLTLPETQDLLTGIALQTEGKEFGSQTHILFYLYFLLISGPKIVAPKSAAKAMPLSLDHLCVCLFFLRHHWIFSVPSDFLFGL